MLSNHKQALSLLLALIGLMGCTEQSQSQSQQQSQSKQQSQSSELNLHVASPDWRDQIIYFLMIDRFNDGLTSNNDQGANVYNPEFESHYSGGDLLGIIEQVDYIKNLGATSVWITPPVANQWWHKEGNYGGYHGYWARDFKAVDAHYGTLDDYRQLSSTLHDNDMYLIQDIVANHSANLFTYLQDYSPVNTALGFKLFAHDNLSKNTPSQYPFNLFDRLNPKHEQANIYHWTPPISDYSDPVQEFTYQLASLADLNTSNPLVRETLKESYNYWLNEVGVDAFRVDTVKYVEHEFWHDFFHSDNGIFTTAERLGKDHFLAFGEVFDPSPVFENHGEHKLVSFLGSATKPELNSIIGFPLYFELDRVFAQGQPTAQLAYRLEQHMQIYPDPFVIPNFVDNHDTPRFLANGSVSGFKQALATILTIPGIPVIYQGDEQGLTETRQAMFAGGFHNKESQFSQETELYRFIQQLATLRTESPVLRRGDLNVLLSDSQGAGLLAFSRTYQNQRAVIIINSADSRRLLSSLDLSKTLKPNQQLLLTNVFSEQASALPQQLTLSLDNTMPLEIPANSIVIYLGETTNSPEVEASTSSVHASIELSPLTHKVFDQDFTIRGQLRVGNSLELENSLEPKNNLEPMHNPELEIKHPLEQSHQLLLILDNNLDEAITVIPDSQGNFEAEIAVNDLGSYKHQLQFYHRKSGALSTPFIYTSRVEHAEINSQVSSSLYLGKGPIGRYQAPLHSDSLEQRKIERAQASAAGANMKLTLVMANLTNVWGAPNGFDNVSINVFISDNSEQGLQALPKLNANMPDNKYWQLGHSFFGWGNNVYTSHNASVFKEGQRLAVAPEITVNEQEKTITIEYQGQHLGLNNWDNKTLYITTWDKSGEGHYRELKHEADNWSFGGGDHSDPKIMDAIKIHLKR